MRLLFMIFSLCITLSLNCQMRSLKPIDIAVNWNKTTHVIFPSKIKYFSSVEGFIVADKIENLLSIKANSENFEGKSSLSIVFGILVVLIPLMMHYIGNTQSKVNTKTERWWDYGSL